ncbi:16S rRNA (cytosine(1402)-N(4))-methyltransferase RsmH [Permianibacter aggregans]|uniref:Ribosomal RNA small subunit methyltransferase H n=1 Tax=Permianibacter aggregans TaxID=1510150 RepID=A0A4R6UHB2_9GAMM|nr:16S rRNA (cytosine(1402)-N(4))-methyltransferase RsmH [Permianibacter aggregans]QGX39038.1 16S rRNA (cytosine(1402)-N(4))-methyltransferase RsmH [Permianibacter aggregans]TDQ44623.1 16S rRNA (cytosine1402-N4)-methyltransferase [Permianibacter aggregans]
MHESVLLHESLAALNVHADGIYVDATFGRGGHSGEILKLLGERGRLLAFDRDPQAVQVAKQQFADDARFEIIAEPFSAMSRELSARDLMGKVNGILMDLGVSSPQLDEAARGFSFMRDGELDMRMDPTRGFSAAEFIATAKESDLADVIYRLGEDRQSRRIARAIVTARQVEPITRTLQLAKIVADALPRHEKHKHPATRTFLALRLYVNDELGEVERTLPQAVDALAAQGRLAVISFHSLEDRIVKLYLRDEARGPQLPKDLPVRDQEIKRRIKLVDKIMPGEAELKVNPRARSAVLRVAERIR